MKRLILVSGWKSSPQDGFAPWLIATGESIGYSVEFFKIPLNWLPTTWLAVPSLKKQLGDLNEDTVIICHSFGALVLLKLAPHLRGRARHVVFIAPLVRKATLTKWLKITWKVALRTSIRHRAKDFTVIHSKDDKLVPFENGAELAQFLGAKMIAHETSGHFCPADGITEIPDVEKILRDP